MALMNSNSDSEVFFFNDGFVYLFDVFSSDGLKRFCRSVDLKDNVRFSVFFGS